MTRNPEIGNNPAWVFLNIWRLEWVRDTKFGSIFPIKCYWMLQNVRVTAFIISELLREKQQWDKITLPPSPHPRPPPPPPTPRAKWLQKERLLLIFTIKYTQHTHIYMCVHVHLYLYELDSHIIRWFYLNISGEGWFYFKLFPNWFCFNPFIWKFTPIPLKHQETTRFQFPEAISEHRSTTLGTIWLCNNRI